MLLGRALAADWGRWLAVTLGFVVVYYGGLLLATMLRFREIPNYVVFHDVIHVYGLILAGTPSWSDAFTIMLGEPWFETGYKNPEYYGVATWSYMLIPPKMLIVALFGALLATAAVLLRYGRGQACPVASARGVYTAAGAGSVMVALTSATLTWVVCCATPSWVVALAMLGMSASLALWLEPLGKVLTLLGLGIMIAVIVYQLRRLGAGASTVGAPRGAAAASGGLSPCRMQ
jgi:hypothetical protein